MMEKLNKFFELDELGTTFSREILAGLTTFLTMSYIIFVQPGVLSGLFFGMETGMDFDSVMVATCLSAAVASFMMGLVARYPIALAPGMGANFFFVFTALPAAQAVGVDSPWRTMLGVVFLSGLLFIILSIVGFRKKVTDSISSSLKQGIAVGIGLFIALIGLRNSRLIISDPASGVSLTEHITSPDILVFALGLVVAAALFARRKRGAILFGILTSTLCAIVLKLSLDIPESNKGVLAASDLAQKFQLDFSFVSAPPSIKPTLFELDIMSALTVSMIPLIIIFLFMDFFDTMGTLIGVSEEAGLMKDGELPRANQAFLSDAVGTSIGALAGTSTVTSYIESGAGVEEGGRSGLVACIVGCLFLLALFFSPLVQMVGSYPAITAPALVLVGSMMVKNVVHVDWSDYTESLPAFVIMIMIPFSYSIGDGLAIGFIIYPILKVLSGRHREVSWIMYVMCFILTLYFVFLRSGTIG